MNLDQFRKLGKPINESEQGSRLDSFLAKKFLFHSRTKWAEIIRRGDVLVSQTRVKKPCFHLRFGQEISYFCPQELEPEVNTNIEIIWQDDEIMAIYKPPNLPMHEGGMYRQNTFRYLLDQNMGPEWSFVHRLDRETSGIVLCAKTRETRNYLSELFITQKIQKTYFAIVFNDCPQNDFWVDQPLGVVPGRVMRNKHWVSPEGLESRTFFQKIDSNSNFSFFKVMPKTGRTHQIRIHSSHSGFPLIGDARYCGIEEIFLENQDVGFTKKVQDQVIYNRLGLHAGKLEFIHPKSLKKMTIQSPLPKDFKQILVELKLKQSP